MRALIRKIEQPAGGEENSRIGLKKRTGGRNCGGVLGAYAWPTKVNSVEIEALLIEEVMMYKIIQTFHSLSLTTNWLVADVWDDPRLSRFMQRLYCGGVN
jgi:hypothetical protein